MVANVFAQAHAKENDMTIPESLQEKKPEEKKRNKQQMERNVVP